MKEALDRVRADYADVCLVERWCSNVLFRRRELVTATNARERWGVARVRDRRGGVAAVAFAGDDPAEALARAAELATRSPRGEISSPLTATGSSPSLPSIPIRQHDSGALRCTDPRHTTLAVKRARLEQWTADLLGVDRRVQDARTRYRDAVTETWVATSEGSSLHDLRAETALSALAVAVEDGAVERGLLSVAVPGGAEAVEPHLGLFQEVAARAVERLHARPVREGRYTVVLDPRAAGLALVYPVAVRCRPLPPGEEFEPLPLGARIGPEWLSIGDDPTAANLRTSLVLDHEGTPVSNAALVQNGVVVGRVESRASAGARNASPTGHALCAGWGEAPAPRLINTYLASGKGDLHTMLEGVEQGLYLSDGLSVRIVGNTLRFEPGSARFIRHGELSEPVKCPPIETALYPWLGRLDAVAADFVWDLSDASFERGGMILGAPHVRLVDVPVGEAVR